MSVHSKNGQADPRQNLQNARRDPQEEVEGQTEWIAEQAEHNVSSPDSRKERDGKRRSGQQNAFSSSA